MCSLKVSHSLGLEVQVALSHPLWVLETKPRLSARAVSALSHWAISPAPKTIVFNCVYVCVYARARAEAEGQPVGIAPSLHHVGPEDWIHIMSSGLAAEPSCWPLLPVPILFWSAPQWEVTLADFVLTSLMLAVHAPPPPPPYQQSQIPQASLLLGELISFHKTITHAQWCT